MDVARQEVTVTVTHPSKRRFCCSQCDRELAVFDHLAERRWRHLNSCQFMTFLQARPPRVDCSEHGKVQIALPWAESGSRFTNMFEALAIDVLLAANVKRAAQLLRISWDEASGVMRRAVARGRASNAATVPQHLGVDEKAIAKGYRDMSLVCDLEHGSVEYVGEDRSQGSLGAYFEAFTAEELQGVEAMSMDMWEPYIKATNAAMPNAQDKIVFDRLHIMQQVLRALDRVRRAENKDLRAEGDETLVRTKYLWLRSAEKVPLDATDHFAALKSLTLKTDRAWALKESLRTLWDSHMRGWALRFWKSWYSWATRSQLGPMIEAARTIQRHLHNVLTFFDRRITNAVAEGLNSKISMIQKRSCGFRNRNHFKIAVYSHCGGPQPLPFSSYPRNA